MALELIIVTPEGQKFSGEVERVELPGSEGEFGVLENHERFLAPLAIGEVDITTNGGPRFAALSEGFADVSQSQVTVMVSTCEFAEEIDKARAERAKARAEEELRHARESREADRSFAAQEAALKRAIVRMSVADRRL